MQAFNCIIVEDEPLAAEVLQDYVAKVPFLELKAVCNDAIYAMEVLQTEKVDLIFLDIHLPKLKGIDFLQSLAYRPQVIITSAYHEYAVQAFEYNVLDYLLKPIEYARFQAAVNKLPSAVEKATLRSLEPILAERPYQFFNVGKKKVKIYLDQVLYIEGSKEYIRIITMAGTIITKMGLQQAEELLDKDKFIRVHKSFIVARKNIAAYSASEIELANIKIPIGRSYKEAVHLALK